MNTIFYSRVELRPGQVLRMGHGGLEYMTDKEKRRHYDVAGMVIRAATREEFVEDAEPDEITMHAIDRKPVYFYEIRWD